MAAVIFDCETAPAPLDEILRFAKPFDESSLPHPGEFDPAAVKYGNTLDQTKRLQKLMKAEEKHRVAVSKNAATLQQARDAYVQSLLDGAALSATTGSVVAIGYMVVEGRKTIIDGVSGDGSTRTERHLLEKFWEVFRKRSSAGDQMLGFNTHEFDLPFLRRRSWLLGVDVPAQLMNQNRYWHGCFIDLLQVWRCGVWREATGGLDAVARAFGHAGKNGDGAEFHRLWRGTAEERQQAVEYLKNDLEMVLWCGERMGVC